MATAKNSENNLSLTQISSKSPITVIVDFSALMYTYLAVYSANYEDYHLITERLLAFFHIARRNHITLYIVTDGVPDTSKCVTILTRTVERAQALKRTMYAHFVPDLLRPSKYISAQLQHVVALHRDEFPDVHLITPNGEADFTVASLYFEKNAYCVITSDTDMLCCGCDIALADTLKFDETLLCTFVSCSTFCTQTAKSDCHGMLNVAGNKYQPDDVFLNERNVHRATTGCQKAEPSCQHERQLRNYDSARKNESKPHEKLSTNFPTKKTKETAVKLPIQLFRIAAILSGNDRINSNANVNTNTQRSSDAIKLRIKNHSSVTDASFCRAQRERFRGHLIPSERISADTDGSLKRKRQGESQWSLSNSQEISQHRKSTVDKHFPQNAIQEGRCTTSYSSFRNAAEQVIRHGIGKCNAGKRFQQILEAVRDYYDYSLRASRNDSDHIGKQRRKGRIDDSENRSMRTAFERVRIDEDYLFGLCEHFGFNKTESQTIVDSSLMYDISTETIKENKKECQFEQLLFSENKLLKQAIFPEKHSTEPNSAEPGVGSDKADGLQCTTRENCANTARSFSNKLEIHSFPLPTAFSQESSVFYESFYKYYYLHKNIIHSEVIDCAKRGLIYLFPETEFLQDIQQHSATSEKHSEITQKDDLPVVSFTCNSNESGHFPKCATFAASNVPNSHNENGNATEKSFTNSNEQISKLNQTKCVSLVQQETQPQIDCIHATKRLFTDSQINGQACQGSSAEKNNSKDGETLCLDCLPTAFYSSPIGLIKSEPLIRFIALLRAASVVDMSGDSPRETFDNFSFQLKTCVSTQEQTAINNIIKKMKSEGGKELYIYGVNGDAPLFKKVDLDYSREHIECLFSPMRESRYKLFCKIYNTDWPYEKLDKIGEFCVYSTLRCLLLHRHPLLCMWEAKALAVHSLRLLKAFSSGSETLENLFSQTTQTLKTLQISPETTRNRALRLAALFDSVRVCLDISRTLRLFNVGTLSTDLAKAKAELPVDGTFESYPPSCFFNGTLWQLEYAIAVHSQCHGVTEQPFSTEIEELWSILVKSVELAKQKPL